MELDAAEIGGIGEIKRKTLRFDSYRIGTEDGKLTIYAEFTVVTGHVKQFAIVENPADIITKKRRKLKISPVLRKAGSATRFYTLVRIAIAVTKPGVIQNNTTKMSVYRFHSHRVHSCGCLYRESRAMVNGLRRDIVNESSLSLIVYTKKRSTANQSGHPGVWYNKRSARWEAYINFQKKRYHLGSFKQKEEAVSARQSAEKKLHDPVVIEHFDDLTRESQETFIRYLLSARKEP